MARLIEAGDAESVFVSSISVWEVARLVQRQRLELTMPVTEWLRQAEALTAVRFAPVDNRIAVRSVLLPPPLHSDPADRIIIATALHLQATLITKDRKLRDYPHVAARW